MPRFILNMLVSPSIRRAAMTIDELANVDFANSATLNTACLQSRAEKSAS